MSATLHQPNPETAIGKLHAFCSAHSLFKTDEELRNSFDHFLVRSYPSSVVADKERLQTDYRAFEELLPVLDELAEVIIAEIDQHKAKEIPEADFGNHLYASLKRHPE